MKTPDYQQRRPQDRNGQSARRVVRRLPVSLRAGAIALCGIALAMPVTMRADAGEGSPLFDQYCMACHGPDARGVDGLGVDLVRSTFVSGSSSAVLVEFLKEGRLPDDPASVTGRPMPGFSWVTDGELQAIAEYLKSQAGRD